jgi:hypothetical protein
MQTKKFLLLLCLIPLANTRSVRAGGKVTILESGLGYVDLYVTPVVDAANNIYFPNTVGGTSPSDIDELSANHQTLTVLPDAGSFVLSALVSDPAGNLYITNNTLGPPDNGSVIELSGPNHSTVTTLYDFNNASPNGGGSSPYSLTFANGNLYGTTEFSQGKNTGPGVVFRLSGPTLQNISSISTGSVGGSAGTVAVDSTGTVYGINGNGVFSVTPDFQTVTQQVTFNINTPGNAAESGLIADAAGNLYGTFGVGGPAGDGVVFELSGPNHQTFTTLHDFVGPDGISPFGALTMDADGDLFGIAESGVVYELSGPNHQTFTNVATYTIGSDFATPLGGLAHDSQGNLYGLATESYAGPADLFEVTNSGFVVPEPSTLSLLLLAAPALLRRRKTQLRQG